MSRPTTMDAPIYQFASCLADLVVPTTSRSMKVRFRRRAHQVVWCTSRKSTLRKRRKSFSASPVSLLWQMITFLWKVCSESVYKQRFSAQECLAKEDAKSSEPSKSFSKVEDFDVSAETNASSGSHWAVSIPPIKKKIKKSKSKLRWAFWKKSRAKKESQHDDDIPETDESTASMTIDKSSSNEDCDWSLESPKKLRCTPRKLFRRPTSLSCRRREQRLPKEEKLQVPHTVVIQLRQEVVAQTLPSSKVDAPKCRKTKQHIDPQTNRARECLNDLAKVLGA